MNEVTEPRRRAVDGEITSLVMAVERLAENQGSMNSEIKELVKETKEIKTVIVKMDHLKELHTNLDARVAKIESSQESGCPALRKHEVERNSFKKECDVNFNNVDKRVAELESERKKVLWGIATAVGMAVLGLVLKSQ